MRVAMETILRSHPSLGDAGFDSGSRGWLLEPETLERAGRVKAKKGRVLATPGEATDENISAIHYPSVTSKSQLKSADARSPRRVWACQQF